MFFFVRIVDWLIFESPVRIVFPYKGTPIAQETAAALDDDRARDFIFTLMDAVNSKVAALLGHISLVIAALTFMYSFHDNGPLIKKFILFEICVYFVLTVLCLRCIRMTAESSNVAERDRLDNMFSEFSRRRHVFNVALVCTVVTTTALILAVFAKAFQ